MRGPGIPGMQPPRAGMKGCPKPLDESSLWTSTEKMFSPIIAEIGRFAPEVSGRKREILGWKGDIC